MKTDNELIAEFMGVKEQQGFYDSYGQDEPFWYTANDRFRTHSRSIPDVSFDEFIEHCKYDTSWDWLMPVVEKIEKTPELFHTRIMAYADENNYLCDIVDSDNYERACQLSTGSKIDAVYRAVVQFIKWYNEQKK
jgi:hypothetical protein